MLPMYVRGVGLCSSYYGDVRAFVEDREDRELPKPNARLLPPALRRRASELSRAMADALGQALAQSGGRIDTVPTVFASAYGESATLLSLLEQLNDDGVLSPIRFSTSVHNAAGGLLSIAGGNRAFTTSIAAGLETVALGLGEAAAILASGEEDVVLVCGDGAAPTPLIPIGEHFETLAVALHLSLSEGDGSPLGCLSGLCQTSDGSSGAMPQRVNQWPKHATESLSHNPCSAILGLVVGLSEGQGGTYWLEHGASETSTPPWRVTLTTSEGAA